MTEIRQVIERYSMDADDAQRDVKKIRKEPTVSKLPAEKQDKVILNAVKLAGREGLEVYTAFLLLEIEIRSKAKMDDILTKFRKFLMRPSSRRVSYDQES